MTRVYAIEINNSFTQIIYDDLLSLLPRGKYEKYKKYHNISNSWRSLLGEALVRYLICQEYNIPNNVIRFKYNEYGKPFISNTDFQFNISHSGKWIVCAINNKIVGIDIELIKNIDLDIARHCFSKDECRELYSKKEEERLLFFYELWTLKESYIKAVGKGLSVALDSFTISNDQGHVIIQTNDNNDNKYYFKQYKMDDQHAMAVCALNDRMFSNTEVIDISSLLSLKDGDMDKNAKEVHSSYY